MTQSQTIERTAEDELALVKQLTGVSEDNRIVANDYGWTSRVYIIDDGDFVVKFPRREEVRKEYRQEEAIYAALDSIRGKVDVQLPRLRWSHPDNDYLGYEGIRGVLLDSEGVELTDEQNERLGKALGGFTKQLGSISLENPHAMTIEDEIKQYQTKYQHGLESIRTHLDEAEQHVLEQLLYIVMPAEYRRLGANPKLCHGDLGYWNILLTSDGGFGIIDFGDIGMYDEAKDFSGIETDIALDAALKAYGDTPLLREKTAWRRRMMPILDIAYYQNVNDQAGLEKTFGKLRQQL